MNTNQIAHLAALAGEPARTCMLLALMDGRALTARELAEAAHITPATASRHLALLMEAGLLSGERQGRHRYHRLGSPDVAHWLEGLMQLAGGRTAATPPVTTGPRDVALRTARTCYDHLAGRLGVSITDHLVDEGAIVFDDEAAGRLTARAGAVLARMGIDAQTQALPAGSRRPLCRPCLDWSERRAHVAGWVGARVCAHCLDQGWLRRKAGSRALSITPLGAARLRDALGMTRWEHVMNAAATP